MENQLDSVTEKPTCFLRLQGLACDWSKHNKHSRNIFSVHGFLHLSVSEGIGKLLPTDTHNDVLSNCGSQIVIGNVQQVSQFLKREAYKFPEKQRYGVLTPIEFLPLLLFSYGDLGNCEH